jgi:hypothetical protein
MASAVVAIEQVVFLTSLEMVSRGKKLWHPPRFHEIFSAKMFLFTKN